MPPTWRNCAAASLRRSGGLMQRLRSPMRRSRARTSGEATPVASTPFIPGRWNRTPTRPLPARASR